MKDWTEDDAQHELDERIDHSLRRSFAAPNELHFQVPRRGGTTKYFAAAAVVALASTLAFLARPEPKALPSIEVAKVQTVAASPERPDLSNLYDEILSIPLPIVACTSEPSELSLGIANRLESRCGDALELAPEAAELLVGPFSSADWPTGTVLAGYPDGLSEPAVVLVAECADYQECCIDLSACVGLQYFSAEFGGVTVTEITPHAEPRMLGRLALR